MLRGRRSNRRRVESSSMGPPPPSTGSHLQPTESAGGSAALTAVSAPRQAVTPNMSPERTLNLVRLLGRVVESPIEKGWMSKTMVEFFMATHSSYTTEEGEQTTDRHRICVFKRSLRERVFSHLECGQRVFLVGEISYKSPEDDDFKPCIIADQIVFFREDEKYKQ